MRLRVDRDRSHHDIRAMIGTDTDQDHPSSPQGEAAQLRGVAVIQASLKTMPAVPGVYRMIGADGQPLYVGKARNLKKRVTSYANLVRHGQRIARMISETTALEIVTTHTEAEALLLEANLIKRLKPRYNIVLRDDKSHPYILLTGDHDWPQLVKHRGARDRKGEYFGPFASAGAVNRTLNALQRAFPIRSCSDSVFATRSRPCLQYQIKRCTAPCVGLIGRVDYAELVGQARDFLSGKSQDVQGRLSGQMQTASDRLEFESAAVLRDRLRALAHIQSQQDINVRSIDEADVIAAHQEGGHTCIQVFFYRGGSHYGNRAYFPSHHRSEPVEAVVAAFIAQYYENRTPPKLVLLSHAIDAEELIAQALGVRAGRRVTVTAPLRGDKQKLVAYARDNAREALARRLSESAAQRRLLDGVAEVLGLDSTPRRIEVYDNSHISGHQAVGAMIVAGADGLQKNAYRKFNIRTAGASDGAALAAPGDDYAMMREVLGRRFARLRREDPDRDKGQWPDLVLIDGGAGQLSSVQQVFADLGVADVPVAAIAKGPDRDAGRERFHVPGRAPFMLQPDNPVLYFLQRLRDEAHRFAISSHRARRSKSLGRSEIDSIEGIGSKRKRALLHRFGSARAVADAALADLETVDGISRTVAKRIYDHFHGDG